MNSHNETDFAKAVDALAGVLAQMIVQETLRRTGPASSVDAINRVAKETLVALGKQTNKATVQLVRAANNEASIAAFRRELNQ